MNLTSKPLTQINRVIKMDTENIVKQEPLMHHMLDIRKSCLEVVFLLSHLVLHQDILMLMNIKSQNLMRQAHQVFV